MFCKCNPPLLLQHFILILIDPYQSIIGDLLLNFNTYKYIYIIFRSILVNKNSRSRSLDRKKAPKLLETHNVDDQTYQIYAQSATDYSATEDDDNNDNSISSNRRRHLKVPSPSSSSGLKKSKSFGQFECELSADEADEKKRTMMAFFSGDRSSSKTPEPSKSPRPIVIRQQEEEEEEDDVDAMFESLLNNTFDESQHEQQLKMKKQNKRQKGVVGKAPILGEGSSNRGGAVSSVVGANAASNKASMMSGGVRGGIGGVAPPKSPSPTQSEYDTCGGDPWDDY